jgi:hypothetical protein
MSVPQINRLLNVAVLDEVMAGADPACVHSVRWRTRSAVLLTVAWQQASTPTAPDFADPLMAELWAECLPWPRELVELAMKHPEATPAELVRIGHRLVSRETWEAMLACPASQPWLAAATPPGRRYSLDWPEESNLPAP